MAQSYKVKINDLWLTGDGTETGRPCRLELRGASAILSAVIGNTQTSEDGKPFNESPLTPIGAGRQIEIAIPKLSTGVFDDLKTILDTAAAAPGTEFNITATGEPGDFDIDCLVFYNPVYLDFGLFIDGSVKSVIIRAITTQINAI